MGKLEPARSQELRQAVLANELIDIGGAQVLHALRAIAPVAAVRGNNDTESWARELPEHLTLEFEHVRIYVLHDLKELDLNPREHGLRVVVAGHSHQPRIEERDGVLFVNPGSAGPRRFKLPVTVALLEVTDGGAQAHIAAVL